MVKLIHTATAFLIAVLLIGCPTTESSVTLRVSPAALSLSIGESQRLTATSTDSNDRFQWSSNAPDIATVSSSGLVRAISEGNATITVRTTQSMLSKTVRVAVPGSVSIAPRTLLLKPTQLALLSAQSTDPGDRFEWTSSDPAVATVDANGIVTGVAAGDALITATGSDSQSKSNAAVTVFGGTGAAIDLTPAELVMRPAQFTTVTATSSDPADSILWNSSDTSVAMVDSTGLVTAVAPGEATIAAIGTHSVSTGTLFITVLAESTATVSISPTQVVLRPSRSITLIATSTAPEDGFNWTSSDSDVATVDASGTVSALTVGQATIRAQGTVTGAESSTSVSVSASAPATVRVSPGSVLLRPAGNALLVAISSEASDVFTWSSSNTSVATVDNSGNVTAAAVGSATVTATGSVSGASGSTEISVAAAPPAEITLTPEQLVLQPDQSASLVAASTDAEDSFTWFSSDTTVALVDASGTVTGVEAGQATVVARGTNSAAVGTAAVTIAPAAVTDVSVTPSAVVLRTGSMTTLRASSTDALDAFTWSSSDETVATVDAAGLVTALAAGSAAITATGSNSGNSGTALVTVNAAEVVVVTVSPAEVQLRPSETATLSASSTDPGDTITWRTSDPAIATVNASGVVTAVSEGEVTVLAQGSNSRVTGTAALTVLGRVPAEIAIDPGELTLQPGQTAILEATSTDESDGFLWMSSDTAVATVDGSGQVTALSSGEATITATGTASGDSGTATLSVAAIVPTKISIVPTELVLRPARSATLSASSTNSEDIIQWDSGDGAVATISPTGVVTAVAEGETTITASGSASNAFSTAAVTVAAAEAARIDVSPAAVEVAIEQTAMLSATSTDSLDTIVWTSANPEIATVDSSGAVTGIAEGDATITARGTNSRAVGSAFVRVFGTETAVVSVAPAEVALHVGDSTTLVALSTDIADTFTWASRNAAVAIVNATGVVTGIAPGTTIIEATGAASGSIGTALISVTSVQPVEITVTPSTAALLPLQTVQLVATSTDPEDTFTWRSENPAVATVNGTGLVTAVTDGIAAIVATGVHSGGTGVATVTVTAVVPIEVDVTPDASTLRPTQTVQLAASSTDPEDTFTWSSGNTVVASVDGSGLVTALAAGEATIVATGSRSGSTGEAAITVAGVAPAVIEVTPPTATLRPLQSVQLAAASSDSEDTFTWTSLNPGIATVDEAGLVIALAAGEVTIQATGSDSGDAGNAIITVAGTPVATITVDPVESALKVGQKTTLSASSSNLSDGFVWSSSNTGVATITQGGTVTAVAVGMAQITATGTNSGDSGTAQVTVGSAEVFVASTGAPLPVGAVKQATATSSDPLDTLFQWSSSDESVAAVSQTGVVLGVSEGTAIIRAVGNASGSAGLLEVSVVPTQTSLLLWNGEAGYSGANGSLNQEEAFRGQGCLEAAPTKFTSPTVNFTGYPGHRADLSGYDEIWFFAKSTIAGRSTGFRVRSFTGQSNSVTLGPYIANGALGLDYRLVRIPIADLQTASYNLGVVENIFFGVAIPVEGHRFFVDDIWAVDLAGTNAEEAPLVGPIPGIDFGDVAVGSTSSRDLTVSNIGNGALVVSNISVAGLDAKEFSVSTTLPFTIENGQSRSFTVTFAPASVLEKGIGDKSATIVLAHTQTPMGGTTELPVTGRATSSAIAVSESVLAFGQTAVGRTATRTFAVENPGNTPLSVTSITSSSGAYTVSPSSFMVASEASQTVEVTFAPTEAVDYAGTLTVSSNATVAGTVLVGLQGAGIAADAIATVALTTPGITSSTVRVQWPSITGVESVAVYLGPEPGEVAGGPLPVQQNMATVDGAATSHTVENLAPGVDLFFHVEFLDSADQLIAQGNAHAKTLGGPKAPLDGAVREVHLVAPNILEVVVANLQVHSFTLRGNVNDGGLDEVIGEIGAEVQAGPWTITRQDGMPIEITSIFRQSVPVGAPYYDVGTDSTGLHLNLLDVDHHLFFVLAEPVGNHEFLSVVGPEITRDVVSLFHEISQTTLRPSFLLPFSDKYLETTAIQLNQVGYSPEATERYAYVSTYMGDGGPMAFTSYPASARVYEEPADPLAARTLVGDALPITLRSALDTDSGTPVMEIDLSSLPAAEGTYYRIHIPGVGVSWPTQVSETAVFRTFYTITRFLTHTRWGRVLSPDWTEWSPRPADHPTVFTSDLHPIEFRFIPEATPKIGQRLIAGGHHDAADFDITYAHSLHALNLLRILELRPEVFSDGQLTIPESGNGLADYLDEILYELRVWELLQEADGGVRPGFESVGHPTSINYADLDALPYWTFGREPYHTMRVAGLFAQAATLLKNIDPDKSAEYEDRAIAAYDWAVANGVTPVLKGPIFYASGELYRLTGDPAYRATYEAIYDADNPFNIGPSVHPFLPWAASWFLPTQPILLDHSFGYLLSDDPDAFRVEEMFDKFAGYAEDAVEDVETLHAHRNGRRPAVSPDFGRASSVGEYVKRIYARLQMGDVPPDDLQRYFNAMSLSADYILGANPLGMVWFSGLGTRRPMEPQHADSQTFVHSGFPAIPGIGVYGPRRGLPDTSTYDFGRKLFYPALESLPLVRRYADVNSWPATNEFTIQEVQVPHIQLFGMLIAPGMMPPDSWLPGGADHRNTLATREDATPEGKK